MSQQARCRSETTCSGGGPPRTLRSVVRGVVDTRRHRSPAMISGSLTRSRPCGRVRRRTSQGDDSDVVVIATAGLVMLALFGIRTTMLAPTQGRVRPDDVRRRDGEGTTPTGGGVSPSHQPLHHDVSGLSTDSLYLLGPTVTLAGAVGAIFWALGHRRGPSIMGGAVAAGVLGASIKLIVS